MPRSWTIGALAALFVFVALAFFYRTRTAPPRPRSDWKASTPFPDEVRVEPPAPNLPPKAAALSGIWQGLWDLGDGRYLPTTVAIERVTPARVSAVYSWGTAPWNPPPSMEPGWLRVPGKLEGETAVLRWGSPPEDFRVTLTLKEDGRAFAEYSWTSYHATALLEKVR